jgi:hypothetical protein
MIRNVSFHVILLAALFAPLLPVQADNFCMDCIQRQIKRTWPNKMIYYQSDGVCCMTGCFGYAGYEMKEADRGYGCRTSEGDGVFVVGDYCNSGLEDLGCPNDTDPLPVFTPLKPKVQQPPSNPDENPESPIVVDIAGDGYRFTSATAGVRFDIRNSGVPVQIAWTRLGTENAFLALDRDGNGRIDSGAELFGNRTPLRSGNSAPNGFVALAELDGNGDEVIDARDAGWPDLLLWTDRNHDGMSTGDELEPVSGSRITAFETGYQAVGRQDQWGNEYRYVARFRTSAENAEKYYDIFFRTAE